MNDVLIPVQKLIRKLTLERDGLVNKLEDSIMYFEELKRCANTNCQHAIIDEALRLLEEE